MAFTYLSLLLLISLSAHSATNDLCDILKIANCKGVTKQLRRTSASSIPSTTTAVSLNPANVSFDRGIGLDSIIQSGNPVLFGLSTGTGKMGGALINGSIENSFFGNRVPETDLARLEREIDNTQYRNKKLTLGLGGRLFSNRKFGVDAGLILKKHPEISRINPGFGVSARFWKVSFGASVYRDNFYIAPDPSLAEPLQEDFLVRTFTMGVRLGNFGFDYGLIHSKLDAYLLPTEIAIFSGSYHYENYLFNLAYRKEFSGAPDFSNELLVTADEKSAVFTAVQYSVNSHVIVGINYNYFLLREFSLSATLFL